MTSIKCTCCGYVNFSTALTCRRCDTPLESDPVMEPLSNTAPSTSSLLKRKKSLLALAILFTAVLALGLLYFILQGFVTPANNNMALGKLRKPGGSASSANTNADENWKTTPLIRAAAEGDTYKVKHLIDTGEDVNQRDEIGKTPLIKATEWEWSTTAKLLINAGADLNIRDTQYGWTALGWTMRHCNTEIAEALIAAGIDMNSKDNEGRTALIHAARRGCTGIVKALVNAGADVRARDNHGRTALTGAKELLELNPTNKSCIEAVQLLKEAGAIE